MTDATPEARFAAAGARIEHIRPVQDQGSIDCRIEPTPFLLRDPSLIPRREWIYGRHLIRRFVSVTVAPGGIGKSSLTIAEALAMASGRDLLGQSLPGGPLTVWLWNLEDPRDEIERRIAAACAHFSIGAPDVDGRLYADSGRDQGLCIGTTDRHGTTIHEPIIDALAEALTRRAVDVLIVDPFVSSHSASENDNGAIDAVAKAWGRVAERANCAIELVHHARKLAGAEVTAESARGAVALVSAARSARVLNRMTDDEAARAGIDEPRRYFRTFNDKGNLSPPAEVSDWYRLESIALPNGDSVGVVAAWQWPDPMAEMTAHDLLAVQRALAGQNAREHPQARDWAGHTVARVLGLDADAKHDRARISFMLRTWIKSGALKVVEVPDHKRMPRPCIEVGEWASP